MAMMSAMFRSSAAVLLLMLAACEPSGPQRAASDAVVADAADKGAAWPLLLQHCLASATCNPMSNFGDGVGEASGYIGSAAWVAYTPETAGEGAQDYGAKAVINLFGQRGAGGKAGRPLTIDELPDNLGGRKARRTTLSIEYRAPSGAMEPYFLQVMSPYLTGIADGVTEARLDVIGAAGVLFSVEARGLPVPPTRVNGRYTPPPAMVFHASRNLRDEPLAGLLAALAKGETLSVKLVAADGEVMLQDALYTDGYESGLQLAAASVSDPEIARPLAERCARFAGQPDTFWKVANVTPALFACDPRLPETRR